MSINQVKLIQTQVELVRLILAGVEDPEFEKAHPRGKGGQFVKKGAGAGAAAGAESIGGVANTQKAKLAVEKISRKLNDVDRNVAKNLVALTDSSEVKNLQHEIAKVASGTAVSKSEIESGHHGGGFGETAKAVGMGLVFDAAMKSVIEECDKLNHLENETQAVQDVGRIAAKVVPPVLLLFSNFAPELLVGIGAGEALTTAMVSVGGVTAVTQGVEKAQEAFDMEDETTKYGIELATMTLSAAATREAWLKLRDAGLEKKVIEAIDKANQALIKKAKTLLKKGDVKGYQQLMEDNLPKSATKALSKTSDLVMKALKSKK